MLLQLVLCRRKSLQGRLLRLRRPELLLQCLQHLFDLSLGATLWRSGLGGRGLQTEPLQQAARDAWAWRAESALARPAAPSRFEGRERQRRPRSAETRNKSRYLSPRETEHDGVGEPRGLELACSSASCKLTILSGRLPNSYAVANRFFRRSTRSACRMAASRLGQSTAIRIPVPMKTARTYAAAVRLIGRCPAYPARARPERRTQLPRRLQGDGGSLAATLRNERWQQSPSQRADKCRDVERTVNQDVCCRDHRSLSLRGRCSGITLVQRAADTAQCTWAAAFQPPLVCAYAGVSLLRPSGAEGQAC